MEIFNREIYKSLKIYIANTSWIVIGNLTQLIFGVVTSIIIVRYLGPEKYGVLAYALSIVSIISLSGHLGLNGLIVRELITQPDIQNETLGTALFLKGCGFFVGFAILCCFAFVTEDTSRVEFWVLIIVASSLLFRPSEVIDYWFEAHIQAKYITFSKVNALIITSIVKIILVIINAELIYFAFPSLIQVSLITLLLMFLYNRTSRIPIRSWALSLKKSKELIAQGWIIFLGAFFGILYFKIDQMMLKWFWGSKEVGIYAVAANISEVGYFIPTAVVSSVFPKLIDLKKTNIASYKQRLEQLLNALFLMAFGVSIITTLIANPMIHLLYGKSYQAAGSILMIHIWASVFIFMRAAFSKWILIEEVLVLSLITQCLGAITNIGLNIILIPKYAGTGAAIATLISYATASYFALFFHKKSRPIFWMMSRSFVSPVIYTYRLIAAIK